MSYNKSMMDDNIRNLSNVRIKLDSLLGKGKIELDISKDPDNLANYFNNSDKNIALVI